MPSARAGASPSGARAARRSAAIFDVDGDGDLDIVTNEFNAAPMVLISNLTEKTRVRYLAVRLTGTASNRNGLGAVVKVTAGGTTYTKVMDGNTGYLSHSVYPLYFGLGRGGERRQHRGHVAVRQEADGRHAGQDEFDDRRTRRRLTSRSGRSREGLTADLKPGAVAEWTRSSSMASQAGVFRPRATPAGSRLWRRPARPARTARRSADPARRTCSPLVDRSPADR